MNIKLNLCILLMVGVLSTVNAQKQVSEIRPPAAYDNIHVEKLDSDENASTYLIWVKSAVKAHKHETHSETLYVIEGKAEMTMAGKTLMLEKGVYVFIPKNTVHSVKVISKEPLKVISIQAPEFLGKDRVFVD